MNFITEFFELFGAAYLGDFSKFMFQAGAYSTAFFVMLLIPIAVAFVYYIVLDNILLARFKKWLLTGVCTCAAAAVIDIIIAHQKVEGFTFSANIMDTTIGSGDYLAFGFIVFVYSAIIYLLSSLLLKTFSSRCRNIPF